MVSQNVNIAIVGMGVVGSATVEMLRKGRTAIRKRFGINLNISRICVKDLKKSRSVKLPENTLTDDLSDVMDDPEIDIVVELVGGTDAARKLALEALKGGKHIVTANKVLISKYWRELFGTARDNGCGIQFEASVMAGVPLIRALNEGLAGNQVESMLGILNGTTNYILTRICSDNMEYGNALKLAQDMGLAEPDPRQDVEGDDARYKLSILGSIALGKWLPPESVHHEGITGLQLQDIQYARKLYGYHPKLLAVFKNHGKQVEARVHPAFVPSSHPLAAVIDEYNAVHITADPVGSIMLYGRGAGAMSAASAVASDVIQLARAVSNGIAGGILSTVGFDKIYEDVLPIEETKCKYYMRITTADKPGVLARISGAFGEKGVSIESVYQHSPFDSGRHDADIVMITHDAQNGAVESACEAVYAMRDIVRKKPAVIRIEEGEYGARHH